MPASAGIVEEKDADDFQKQIKEINTGIICFRSKALRDALKKVTAHNRKKEYYLTDVIGIFSRQGKLIDGVKIDDVNEALGINTRVELAKAQRIIQRRIHEKFMKEGVTIIDPDSTFITHDCRIGRDTVIYPFTVIERDVTIGKRCSVGPFAHIRDGSCIKDDVVVGNFLEIVRSTISPKTLVKHFGYIGDAQIGRGVNIGAGTVTANFDGKNKHRSVVGNNAFIGSDTVLVAPVTIGDSAITGAGSVVVKGKHVPKGGIVVGVPAKPLLNKR